MKSRKKREQDSEKLPFVFIREEVEGKVSSYDMNFLSKMRHLIEYMDTVSGRAFKREQNLQRKKQEKQSSLQLGCSELLDKVNAILVRDRKRSIEGREVEAQLDSKFQEVLNTTIATKEELDITVKKVNKNYLRYTTDIPIQISVKRKKDGSLE